MKVKMIYPQPNPVYEADILMRIYPNQSLTGKTKDFVKNWYCVDLHCRNGAKSEHAGHYSANHPQGIEEVMKLLLEEQKNKDISIEIENGMNNFEPHFDCRDREWFELSIAKAIRNHQK